jgi:GTP cyclohydrolase I
MLAFTGVAHVGYIPRGRILGLSKLARLTEHFARRPQVQERLTVQIVDWLMEHLGPNGAGAVIYADHTCMTTRGVLAHGARTMTAVYGGLLQDDRESRREFMQLISMR